MYIIWALLGLETIAPSRKSRAHQGQIFSHEYARQGYLWHAVSHSISVQWVVNTNRCFGKNIAESFTEPRMEIFSLHICDCPGEGIWGCISLERSSFHVSTKIKEMWFLDWETIFAAENTAMSLFYVQNQWGVLRYWMDTIGFNSTKVLKVSTHSTSQILTRTELEKLNTFMGAGISWSQAPHLQKRSSIWLCREVAMTSFSNRTHKTTKNKTMAFCKI